MGNFEYMEDVTGAVADLCDLLEYHLQANYKLTLTNKDNDEIFEVLLAVLERYCDNDYRNYN